MRNKSLIVLLILLILIFTGCNQTPNKEVPTISNTTINTSEFLNNSLYCGQDSDCVQENSCRPTKCVNKYYAEENPVEGCCACEYCEICISCSKCINNKCETEIVGDCC